MEDKRDIKTSRRHLPPVFLFVSIILNINTNIGGIYMKGYKALNMDMSTHGGIIYEIGKKYTIAGELKLYVNGYHFCKCLEDIELYYKIAKSRIFEIEADGEIIDGGNKSCAESITLVRELSKEEIRQYFIDNQESLLYKFWYQIALVDQGLYLDKLINNDAPFIRIEVAKQGYGLETLIHDKEPWVRVAVAKQSYGLNVLVNDGNPHVRAAVATQGYGLDILINDKNYLVREEVARQGYGLETLIHDKNWRVRREVAEQSYGLDTLINDPELYVRAMAATKIQEKHPIISLFHFMIPIMAKLESNKCNSQ